MAGKRSIRINRANEAVGRDIAKRIQAANALRGGVDCLKNWTNIAPLANDPKPR